MNSIESEEFERKVKSLLGLKDAYLPIKLETLLKNLYEAAQAWTALSHLVKEQDRKETPLIQSNRLAWELEQFREKQ